LQARCRCCSLVRFRGSAQHLTRRLLASLWRSYSAPPLPRPRRARVRTACRHSASAPCRGWRRWAIPTASSSGCSLDRRPSPRWTSLPRRTRLRCGGERRFSAKLGGSWRRSPSSGSSPMDRSSSRSGTTARTFEPGCRHRSVSRLRRGLDGLSSRRASDSSPPVATRSRPGRISALSATCPASGSGAPSARSCRQP